MADLGTIEKVCAIPPLRIDLIKAKFVLIEVLAMLAIKDCLSFLWKVNCTYRKFAIMNLRMLRNICFGIIEWCSE